MKLLIPVALLAILVAGCRDMRPQAQDWMVSAPEKTILGVSGQLGWILEMPEFRKYITRYPIFDQALELFLDRAAIDPSSETARISLYVLNIPNDGNTVTSAEDLRGLALIQIAGFRDVKAIQRVVVETFPPEYSLKIGGREHPLFVVLDFNQIRVRLFFDDSGRLWIGDLSALEEIAKKRRSGISDYLARASEWLPATGALQGFAQPELIPKHAFKELDAFIPAGIKGLAWAVTPVDKKGQAAPATPQASQAAGNALQAFQAVNLDLCVTGTEDAVTNLKPWMQRVVAIASTLAGDGMMPPETIQEGARMGVRCQFKQDQLETALKMMNMEELIQAPIDQKKVKTGAPK